MNGHGNSLKTSNTRNDNDRRSLAGTAARVIGLFAGIFLIYWFVSRSEMTLESIRTHLLEFNWKFLIIIGVTFITYFLASIAWYQCFYMAPENITIRDLFLFRMIGESLAQINPANVIAGDTLKAILLKNKGVPVRTGIVSITISRFFIILSGLTLLCAGMFIFFERLKFIGSAATVVSIILFVMVSFIFTIISFQKKLGLFYIPMQLIAVMNRLIKSAKISTLIRRLREIDGEIIEFYLRKKLYFMSAYLLTVLHRLTGAMEFYFILNFLGVNITALTAVAIEIGVMVFKSIGTFVPGQIGIEEYGNKFMLEFVNIPGPEIWVTVSVIKRARQLFWIGFGFIAFLSLLKIKKVFTATDLLYDSHSKKS